MFFIVDGRCTDQLDDVSGHCGGSLWSPRGAAASQHGAAWAEAQPSAGEGQKRVASSVGLVTGWVDAPPKWLG